MNGIGRKIGVIIILVQSFISLILLLMMPILAKQILISFVCSKYILLADDTVLRILNKEVEFFIFVYTIVDFYFSLCADADLVFSVNPVGVVSLSLLEIFSV